MHLDLSRVVPFFDPADDIDYETIHEIRRVNLAPKWMASMRGMFTYYLFPHFRYREPYIGSPGLRHAILSSITFPSWVGSGLCPPRYAYHTQQAKRYLQRKLDRPEELEDDDLFTAALLCKGAASRSIREIEAHTTGVTALLTWLQSRADPNCPLSSSRYMIWDIVVAELLWKGADKNLIYDLLVTRPWTQGSPTRARLKYLNQLRTGSSFVGTLKTFLTHQLQTYVILQENVLLQRRNGRHLSKIRLQSILEECESWIQVTGSLEFTDNLFDVPEFRPEFRYMTPTQYFLSKSSRPAWVTLRFHLYFYALVIYTSVNAGRTVQGLLSVRMSVACLYSKLLYIRQAQIYHEPGCPPCMYTG